MTKRDKTEPLKIVPVRGRPMLHWVGKKPLEQVQYYPAQLVESAGAANPPAVPSYQWYAKSGNNLVFHGDNKEIMSSLLVGGFRGKVDLVYIDPPFDSGADYVRKVQLRGIANGENGNGKISAEAATVAEQVQYYDIWENDAYLQFMCERLILLRELLGETGVIYVHCDYRKSHHLRFLLDEIFGEENFLNTVSWRRQVVRGMKTRAQFMPFSADYLHIYAKNSLGAVWNPIQKIARFSLEEAEKKFKKDERGFFTTSARGAYSDASIIELHRKGLIYVTRGGKLVIRNGKVSATAGTIRVKYYREIVGNEVIEETVADNIWDDIAGMGVSSHEHLGYPTQKPEALLERIIKASSNPGGIVLDCFCGSGTTAAVAEKLGRRWIAADMNKGAVQTTMKRLAEIGAQPQIKQKRGIVHYRVNNYDFRKREDMKAVIVAKYGIERDRRDSFFDGTRHGELVKIAELDKPLTPLDLQSIRDEIAENRPDEERNVTVFCSGCQTAAAEAKAKKRAVNNIRVIDIQKDGITVHAPPIAEVRIVKKGKKAKVVIADYVSPAILERLAIDEGVFKASVGDFRAQIDYVLIDADHKGGHFNICQSDIPARKKDFIRADYDIALPRTGAKVAVKIVDMLGEEVLVVS